MQHIALSNCQIMNLTRFSLFIAAISLWLVSACTPPQQEKSFMNTINSDWTLQNSTQIDADGSKISLQSFDDSKWYKTDIPTTVLNALIQNGVYSDIYFGKNIESIDTKQFETPWWYRKEFTIDQDYSNAQLILDGLNYKANIWLNGKLIADSKTIEGAFKISNLNISQYLNAETNVLAIEVIPPKSGDLTIGFVDWNPTPPDQNMGLWRGVHLKLTGKTSINDVFVQTDVNTETLAEASLELSTTLKNHANEVVSVELKGTIGEINFNKSYTIPANEETQVVLTQKEVAEFLIKDPKLWWPNNLGEPNLYDLTLAVFVDGIKSDEQKVRFGIREIEQFINNEGHKGYKVNGKKVLIRGGGWVDDMLLADTDEKVRAQVEYTRHMNLNTIRLEGFWGANKTIYDAADENGILLMIGWSCHWEWAVYCGRKEYDIYMSIDTPEDMELQSDAFVDQIKWLRNHPSVFLWVYGSDKLPMPELEEMLERKIIPIDPTRPRLSSCRGHAVGAPEPQDSEVSGPVGVKMRGPYSYVTPNYWFVDTEYGGAYGFNTETGPGPQVPPLESMKKMIPADDLWPIGDVWDYHNGRHAFGKLDHYLKAFNARYGEANDVEEFTFMSQISNYEAIRAMFDAFAINKYSATGVIQWMLNSAWPETFWQLYDWYLMPNGAFYGTKKSNAPLHLAYNYGDKKIYVVNEYLEAQKGLTAQIKVLDIDSKELLSETVKVEIEENSSKLLFEFPEIANLTTTYFLDMKLIDANGKEVSNDFYWLSTKDDVLDFAQTNWHVTHNTSFADMTALKTMPEATVKTTTNIEENSDSYNFTVEVENTSDKIAFFIELNLADEVTGNSILPVFWSDNYISLLPGEKKTVSCTVAKSNTQGAPVFSYKGLNIK